MRIGKNNKQNPHFDAKNRILFLQLSLEDAKLKASKREGTVNNMEGLGVGYFLLSLLWSLGWGFATAAVRDRKGYGRRWFWFGFFLGLIPFIIACAIPAKKDDDEYDYLQSAVSGEGWQCSCGRTNAVYVSTCTCGLSKWQNSNPGEQASGASQ